MLPGGPLALLATALLLLSSPARAQEPKAGAGGGEARSGWYTGLAFGVGMNTFERSLQRKLGFNVSTNEVVGVDGRVGYRLHPNFAAELQVEWMSPFRVEAGPHCSSPFAPTQREINDAFPRVPNLATPDPTDTMENPNKPELNQIIALPCRGREIVFPQTDPIRSGDPFRVEPVVATLNGRAYLATGRWQPYLTFGSGIMHIEIRDTAPGAEDVRDFGFALRVGGGLEYYLTEQLVFNLGASYVIPISGRAQDYDYVSFEPFGLTWRFE